MPPRVSYPWVVPPKRWLVDTKPWMREEETRTPQPPKEPPPLNLMHQRLFKAVANIYGLRKLSTGGSAAVAAHVREASALQQELGRFLRVQAQHGPVAFPMTEAWLNQTLHFSF